MDPRLTLLVTLLLCAPLVLLVGNGLRERGGIVTHLFPKKRKKSRVLEFVGITLMAVALAGLGLAAVLVLSLVRPPA